MLIMVLSKDRVLPPAVLYKYMSFDSAKNTLLNKSLKLSLLSDYNDCMELHPRVGSRLPLLKDSEIDSVLLEVFQKEKDTNHNSKIDPDFFKGIVIKFMRFLGEKYGVNFEIKLAEELSPEYFYLMSECIKRSMLCSCFSSNFDIDLMWAHYADKHQGVCIGFKTNAVKEKFVKVEYQYKRVHVYIKDEQLHGSKESAYTKGKQWKYEKEWRFFAGSGMPTCPIIFLSNDLLEQYKIKKIDERYFTSFDINDIDSVYFGLRVDKDNISQIKELFKDYRKVKFYQMITDQNFFKLKV